MTNRIVRVLLAGVAGAVAFAACAQLTFGLRGRGYLTPVNLIAHTFVRSVPTDGAASVTGLVVGYLALLVAALLGAAVYAMIAIGAGLPGPLVVLFAVAFANVVWVIGHYLVWEAADRVAATDFTPWIAWLAHGVYGLVLGLALVGLPPSSTGPVAVSGPEAGMGFPGVATRPEPRNEA